MHGRYAGKVSDEQEDFAGSGVSMRIRTPYVLIILACLSTESASDRLKIENIADGDNVVVMMTLRYATSCRREVLRTTGEVELGNVLPATPECDSDIVVFAAGNALAVSTPAWTDSDDDVHTIKMKPIIEVPVHVWVLHPDGMERARLEVANATLIYRQNKVGVQFRPEFHNISKEPEAVDKIGSWCTALFRGIQNSLWYRENTLNIYYVDVVRPRGEPVAPGWNCDRFPDENAKHDANISYIGVNSNSNLASLAHEIGHALGLRPGVEGGHTELDPDFITQNNVMFGGGDSMRSHFSLGQVFRMNTQKDRWGGTMLIKNGLRPGPERECPPLKTSSTCPLLALDWVRPPYRWWGKKQALANWLEARYDQLVEQSKTISYAPITVSKEQFLQLYLPQSQPENR